MNVPCRRRRRMLELKHQLTAIFENKQLYMLTHFTHMCYGKHRVEHFSLFSVMVPFGLKLAHAQRVAMTGKKLPKVPKSPGPKIKLFPLEMK